MRESHPQLFNILFSNRSAIEKSLPHEVHKHIMVLQELNLAVKALFPAQLQPWCRVANYRQNVLVLETASAAWMMRLRYEQSHLLSALRAQILPSLASIDIKINPTLMTTGNNALQGKVKILQCTAPAPLRLLSQESARELRILAQRSPEQLRHILEKLAALARD